MGNLLYKMQNFFGGDVDDLEEYEDDDLDFDYEMPKKNKKETTSNRSPELQLSTVAKPTTAKQSVVLYKAEHFDDCTEIANSINAKITVVLNLEDSKREVARRIIDFISGVTYANNGQLHKIANMTFIITPELVDVDKDAFDMFVDSSDLTESN